MRKRFFSFFKLFRYFILTEIIAGVEVFLWTWLGNLPLNLISESDPLGVRLIWPFLLLVIPTISAICEYQKNEEEIKSALQIITSY